MAESELQMLREQNRALTAENERLRARWQVAWEYADHELMSALQAEAAVQRVRELHQPRRDPGYSIIDWTYCSCGAMETRIAGDGYPSLGPAEYPCATIRALDGKEEK